MGDSVDNTSVVTENAKEPSINSDDPNERKLARRIRIQRRLDEAARVQAKLDGTYVEPEVEKPPLDQAIEDSEDVLQNLLVEGKELVSNIRVASDAREVERREREVEDRDKRLKVLEEEAAAALEKLNEITSRWEIIQDVNDPLSLHQHMREQKSKCLELIQQKNDLIKNFQIELKIADDKYMKDRRKMYDDLSLLTHRIDEQVLLMKRAYRVELNNIEEVIDSTRSKVMEENQKTWQSLYNVRERNETTNMSRKFKLVEDHEAELDELRKEHEEKYRDTRIRLETDIQSLEQELERVKAICLLNSEKLDYNYQVLKKREEENVYIKNHQKRKLNKLQDLVDTLKKKIQDKQNANELEFKQINQELKKYHDSFIDLEKKAEYFSHVNEETYQNIWDMKTQEASDILQKILSMDKIIYEQILGTTWKEPDVKLLKKTELPSYVSAKRIITQLFSKKEEVKHGIDLGNEDLSESRKIEYDKGHQRLLKQILGMIANQSGFLVEDKLYDLLKPYTSDEKTMVLLDNVFTAIGISTGSDLDIMKNIFLPYTFCPLCENRIQSEQSMIHDQYSEKTLLDSQNTKSQTAVSADRPSKVMVEPSATSSSTSAKEEVESGKEKESLPTNQLLRPKEDLIKRRMSLSCNITHPLMIEKVYVLTALKDFVTEFHADNCRAPSGMLSRLAKQRNTISRLLCKEDVENYWQKFQLVFPKEKEELWDGLMLGLSRYYEILQERHRLNLKAKKMRQQNLELRRLLARYVTKDPAQTKLFLPHMSREEKNVINMDHLHDLIRKVQI